MKKYVFTFGVFLTAAAIGGCLPFLTPSPETIKNKIEEANYCNNDKECVFADNYCHYCYTLVNELEVDRINALIWKNPPEECPVLKCPGRQNSKVVCKSNKCVLDIIKEIPTETAE